MFLSVFLRRLYIWLASLALLVLAGLWLVPREDISVHDKRSPAFDLAKFFDGNSAAYGIFEDRFEDWEQNAIDGTGQEPRIKLGDVRRNKSARFRLQEKYKNLFFADKDADGDNHYYEDDGGDGPLPPAKWEHRKILGLAWENNSGWRLETKLCDDLSGPSVNYIANDVLIRMIRDSIRNRNIRFRSQM